MPVFIRFAICGVGMALIGAVLIHLLSLLDVQYTEYVILSSTIYAAVSILNYSIQTYWVFGKKGSFTNYFLCNALCSLLFGFLNAEFFFAIENKVSFASIISFLISMLIVAPVSFLLNRHIFRHDH